MKMISKLPLSVLVCATALSASFAIAGDQDPSGLPGIGSTAPGFALHPFRPGMAASEGDEGRTALELDSVCGIRRPESTSAVLVFFIEEDGMDDLLIANSWYRKHHRDGLEIFALSETKRPEVFRAAVVKAKFGFPVLDDRHGVVAKRYGVGEAPFSLLLDRDCAVIGMSNRSLTVEQGSLGAAIADIASKAKAERKARKPRR